MIKIVGMSQIEAVVARFDELQNGKKRQVSVGEIDILLIRRGDQVYAPGAYYTHNKAPLAKGVVCSNLIVCPWHNAYFNIATGDQEEPPGLDSLPHYSVKVEDNQVIVTVPESTSDKRTPRSPTPLLQNIEQMTSDYPSVPNSSLQIPVAKLIISNGSAQPHVLRLRRLKQMLHLHWL
jgi:nitrite reductase/ring-hydroxylating ferredoxin subunit